MKMFQIEDAKKVKIHILCSVKSPTPSENLAVYEIMTIWRRVVSWISKTTRAKAHISARAPKPTHTHTEICNTYCFSTATMVT
jgi:hypothetical protein